ncbi:MAG TPA: TIGR01212 family radical SAM protein [Proteobacteria bacterium]|nr:TIGR01212 family radical SAM protein [Pseudomonadota bacterium]
MKDPFLYHPLWVSAKRFYDLKSYFFNRFHDRVYKISLDAGFTCPSRDGNCTTGGCTYCDGRGSLLRQRGQLPSITKQLEYGKSLYVRLRKARKFIAYFQTGTNTYAPLNRLRSLYDEALSVPDVVGLAIGTRPDAITPEVIDLLAAYANNKEIWLEYGLQSMHEQTLFRINRGHGLQSFEEAVQMAAGCGVNLCVHVILGLPGETPEMMLETADYVAQLPIKGIKIHSLLVLKGTPLCDDYKAGLFSLMNRQAYAELVVKFLEKIPPDVVIQRLTAEGYRDVFVAPSWARNKLQVLQQISNSFVARDSWQGKFADLAGDRY